LVSIRYFSWKIKLPNSLIAIYPDIRKRTFTVLLFHLQKTGWKGSVPKSMMKALLSNVMKRYKGGSI